MKVLALVQSPDHVCCRYRIAPFAWALAERGLTLEVAPLRGGVLRRVWQLRAARRVDVVVLQRKLLPLWQLRILRRAAPALVYDVDDAVYRRDSYSRKSPESYARLARFWATVYTADAVITGNEYLQQRTGSYVEPDRVHLVPTCVEPKFYPSAEHYRRGSAIKLVWIGQRSTLPSLNLAAGHLAAAADRLPGLELRVISDRFAELSGIRCVPRRWSSVTEATQLADGDVGICWLPDDQWSRGKCGLKVLQYMAAGLPVVANPIGVHRQMIIQGRTGLLASTPGEWAAAISQLAADPRLRRRLGSAGRQLVQQRYSVDRWGPEFARVIDSVARPAVQRASSGPAVAEIDRAVAAGRPQRGATGCPS